MKTLIPDANRHLKNAVRALFLELCHEPVRKFGCNPEGEASVRVYARGVARKPAALKSTNMVSWAGPNEREALIGLIEFLTKVVGDHHLTTLRTATSAEGTGWVVESTDGAKTVEATLENAEWIFRQTTGELKVGRLPITRAQREPLERHISPVMM